MGLNVKHAEVIVEMMNDGEIFLLTVGDDKKSVSIGFPRDEMKKLLSDLILKL